MENNYIQQLLPGIPEKVPGEHFIPTTAGMVRPTKRQRLFARYYAESGLKAESARRAGFSAKNASKIANELLQKPHVKQLVWEEEEAVISVSGLTRVNTLRKLGLMLKADPRKFYNDDGSLKPPSEWDEAMAAIIAGIEVQEEFEREGKKKVQVGWTKKVKLVDQLRPVELAMKHFGLTQEKVIFPDAQGNPQNIAPKVLQVVFMEKAPGEKGLA
jgi:phage terminase small subunit